MRKKKEEKRRVRKVWVERSGEGEIEWETSSCQYSQ